MAQSLVNTVLKVNKLAVNSLVRANVAIVPASNLSSRQYSTPIKKDTKEKETPVKKSVFISQSSDIFSNLALEDWLYRNSDFSDHHVLLLWRNSPTVVVGRHQNPWLEANTENLAKHGVQLARRNSGGGTVYHDMGNLNLTFFTPREQYNRKHNLEIISRALFREWGIVTEINSREDLTVRGNYKISGTAAKLGRPNAYHHCTLLVDVNKVNLSQALQRQNNGFQTNATRSIPSPVMNLCETNNQVKVERMLGAVGWEFLRTCPHTMVDGGEALISKQRGFQLINPTDQWFPGLEKLRNQLSAWDWRFGKTPRFSVERAFHVPQNLVAETSDQQLKITLEVNGGVISDVTLSIPPGLLSANGFHGEARVVTSLRGQRFSEEAIVMLEKTLCDVRSQERDLKMAAEKSQFVVDCMRQVMQSA